MSSSDSLKSTGIDGASPVLVTDLDGTLCRTDTLHEAVLGLLVRAPLTALRLPKWAASGPSVLKARIADRYVVPGDQLPLNESVIEQLNAAREAGRRTALVTAADQRQAEAVADTLGLFDEVHGSDEHHNLKGQAKADFLTERFGFKGFDYLGDSSADIPVWSASRRAVTIGASDKLRRHAENTNADIQHLSPPQSRFQSGIRALRPHQWLKNLLLFLPMLAAHDATSFSAVLMAFIAFCFTAAAIYVINDLLDLSADRAHPRKRLRPFAAGELTAQTGIVLSGTLLAAALLLALMIGRPVFVAILLVYLVGTFVYSLWLKRKLVVDVLTLAGLYTIRIIAGAAAAGLVLSPWLLAFAMFLFLSLASVKRQAELTDQLLTGRSSSGRAYDVDDLPILRSVAISSGMAAILVLALYITSDDIQILYTTPSLLWILCPILLYWLLRMIMKTHRGHMTDDPIVFAATDRVSQVTLLVTFGILLAAALIG